MPDDLCNHCERNETQIVFQTVTYGESSVLRRSSSGADDQVLSSCSFDGEMLEDCYCFACFIATHGTQRLGDLKINAWRDAPHSYTIPIEWDAEEYAKWKLEQAQQQHKLEMRELEWNLRDDDIFS